MFAGGCRRLPGPGWGSQSPGGGTGKSPPGWEGQPPRCWGRRAGHRAGRAGGRTPDPRGAAAVRGRRALTAQPAGCGRRPGTSGGAARALSSPRPSGALRGPARATRAWRPLQPRVPPGRARASQPEAPGVPAGARGAQSVGGAAAGAARAAAGSAPPGSPQWREPARAPNSRRRAQRLRERPSGGARALQAGPGRETQPRRPPSTLARGVRGPRVFPHPAVISPRRWAERGPRGGRLPVASPSVPGVARAARGCRTARGGPGLRCPGPWAAAGQGVQPKARRTFRCLQA